MKGLRPSTAVFCAVLCAVLIWAPVTYEAQAAPADYHDTVQRVYIGYYQRPADPGGLLYWADRLDKANGVLTEIIDAFANSDESHSLYGTINTNTIATVINSIYSALFNRTADAGGRQYYTAAYAAGQFSDGRRCTEGTIVLDILGGAQNEDLTAINNKLTVAKQFTGVIDPELDGLDLRVTYAGENDAISARNFLSGYATATSVATLDQTVSFVQTYIADPGENLASKTLKTSVIVQRVPAMTLNYALSGTAYQGSQSAPVSGTATVQTLASSKQSPVTYENCFDEYTSFTFSGAGQTLTQSGHLYFLQDAGGSVRVYGGRIEDNDAWVVSPANGYVLSIMSPVAVGQSYGASATLSDGSSLTFTYSIDAIENVSTLLGTYQAYRGSTSRTWDYASGSFTRVTQTGTVWLVPGLGEVKSNMNVKMYSGSTLTLTLFYTAVLSSTNVSY